VETSPLLRDNRLLIPRVFSIAAIPPILVPTVLPLPNAAHGAEVGS
jgi:hypothetical protein